MTRRLGLALLFTAAIGGTVLRAAQPPVIFRGPDEAVYAHYGRVIAAGGADGARENVREYLRDAQLQNFPTPLRLAYLGPLAAVMRITGDETGDRAGVALSLAFSILSILVLVSWAAQDLGVWPAFFAACFLALSPLEIMFSRRVLQDGGMTLLSALALWQACRIADNPERRAAPALLGLLGALLFFFKESGAVVYGIVLAYALAHLVRRPSAAARLVGWSAAFFLPALLVFFALCGGPQAAIDTLSANRRAAAGDIMAFFQDGPWHVFLRMEWLLSPACLVSFFVGAAFIVRRAARREASKTETAALLFTALFFATACAVPHYKNARLLSPLHVPYCLVAGTGVAGLIGAALKFLRPRAAAIALAAAATGLLGACFFNDYANYVQMFSRVEIGEMVVIDRLDDASLYRRHTPYGAVRERIAEELVSQLPAGERPAASEAFFEALRKDGRPYDWLYRFVCESAWSVAPEGHLPTASPALPVPDRTHYLLYDAMDFYFALRPEQQKAPSEFFARGGWQPAAFAGSQVLFKRGGSGTDKLYRRNPAGVGEPPVILGARAEGIELHGIWAAGAGDPSKEGVRIIFDWRCTKDAMPDYYLSVWVVGEDGKTVFEDRRLIAYGLHPTAGWKKDERIVENYRLILPAGAPKKFAVIAGLGRIDTDKFAPFSPSGKVDKNGLTVLGVFEPR